MADQWYYTENRERRGPVAEEQLKQLASTGQLKATDLVWQKGMASWVPGSQLDWLFPKPSGDEPPAVAKETPPSPSPATLVEKSEIDGRHGSTPSLKAIGIVMLVAVTLPCLLNVIGMLASVSNGKSVLFFVYLVLAAQNGFCIFAAITAMRRTSFGIAVIGAFLACIAWIVGIMTGPPIAVSIVFILISLPFGLWSFLRLRRPGVREQFEHHFDPLERAAQWVLPRLPKFKVAPTPINTSRAALATISGTYVLALTVGVLARHLEQTEQATLAQIETATDTEPAKPKPDKWREQVQAWRAEAVEGDQLWDQGKKAEAVERYAGMLSSKELWREESQQFGRGVGHDMFRRCLTRTVDQLAEGDDSSTAHALLKKAIANDMVLPLTSTKAKSLLAVATEEYAKDKERDRAETQEWLRREEAKKQRTAANSGPASRDTTQIEDEVDKELKGLDAEVDKQLKGIDAEVDKGLKIEKLDINPKELKIEELDIKGLKGIDAEVEGKSTGSRSSSRHSASKEEMDRLSEILVKKVRPGMSSQKVYALLGKPHDISHSNVAGENLTMWTYRAASDENYFFMLGFQSGTLVSGGSTGYDIKTGFKIK